MTIMTDRTQVSLEYQQSGFRKIWETVDCGTFVSSDYSALSLNGNAAILYQMKLGLTSSSVGRWTVVASCGKAGGSVLIASLGDNWTCVADVIRGTTSSSPRSWILLRSPRRVNGNWYYMLMDYWWTGSASDNSCANWYFTTSLPDLSALSTITRPPPTGNEWSHVGSRIHTSLSAFVSGTKTYLWCAHDGSFVFAASSGRMDNISASISHYFQSGTVFNILRTGSYPTWDSVQAVSCRWADAGSQMPVSSAVRFQTLHQDGSACSLAQIEPYFKYIGSISYMTHTDDMTEQYYGFPVHLVSIDSGKKCFRGILEDLYMSSNFINDGQPVFKNQVLKSIRVGPWMVPSTRMIYMA